MKTKLIILLVLLAWSVAISSARFHSTRNYLQRESGRNGDNLNSGYYSDNEGDKIESENRDDDGDDLVWF